MRRIALVITVTSVLLFSLVVVVDWLRCQDFLQPGDVATSPAACVTAQADKERSAIAALEKMGVTVTMATSSLSGIRIEATCSTNLNSEMVEYLSQLDSLYLRLMGYAFNDSDLALVSNLKALQGLEINFSNIQSNSLRHIRSLEGLRELHLVRCYEVDDGALEFIEVLKNIEVLALERTAITDSAFKRLWGLCRLRTMLLSSFRFTDAGIADMRGLDGVQSLSLRYCSRITDKGVACLKDMKNLDWVHIDSDSVTREAIDALERAKPTLTVRTSADYHGWRKTKLEKEHEPSGFPAPRKP